MITTPCIVCDNESVLIKNINGYDLYRCCECGLEFFCPMPTDDVLQDFYSNYYDFRQEADVSRLNAKLNINRLKKYGIMNKDIYLLDYACGGNYFIEHGTDKWYGYDKFIKTKSDIDEYIDCKWDFITIWGSLEHFTNPLEIFSGFKKCMNNGCKIAMRVVSTETEIPFRYKPPEHVTFWTKKSIERLFNKSNIQLLEYVPYMMIQDSEVYLRCVMRTVNGTG